VIRWLGPPGRRVRSFHLIGPLDRARYNFGEESIAYLIALDADPNLDTYECASCGTEFEAIGVEIANNVILDAIAFVPGECLERFGRAPTQLNVVEIGHNGVIVIHDEWLDLLLTGPG
jgi:hypothetical protein